MALRLLEKETQGKMFFFSSHVLAACFCSHFCFRLLLDKLRGERAARLFKCRERIDLQALTFRGLLASKVSLVVYTCMNDKSHFLCLESISFNLMPLKIKVVLTVRDFTGCHFKLD